MKMGKEKNKGDAWLSCRVCWFAGRFSTQLGFSRVLSETRCETKSSFSFIFFFKYLLELVLKHPIGRIHKKKKKHQLAVTLICLLLSFTKFFHVGCIQLELLMIFKNF